MLVVDTGVRRDRGMEVEIFSRRHMEWGARGENWAQRDGRRQQRPGKVRGH